MCLKKKTNNKKGCTTTITPEKRPLDEVKQYLNGRYICAYEASWRIFSFDIHSRWPSVERLPIHLPNDKHVSFKGSQNLQEVFDNAGTKKSKLEAWFDANKTYAEAPNLTYSEFPASLHGIHNPVFGNRGKEVMSSVGLLKYIHLAVNYYISACSYLGLKVLWFFFVYGSGGCGKTFLWQTLCCRLRSEHKIVLPIASCGIASVLLLRGRTAHSRFHIPLKLDENCSAGLRHGTDISELLQRTDLIIWEEAPMQHHHAFKCVDRSLRDIMSAIDKSRTKKPFGGITIVFGGDFRQILPVIPKASRAEVVCSTLNKSKLWESCEVFLLKQNMRLNAGNSDLENKTIADFSKWQLAVGDGKETNISPSPDTGNDDNDFRSAFPVEYLNSINMPCIPKHELKLKVGVVVILMRNLNQIMGLCNGTRMFVKSCRKNSIECEILCGSHVGTKHLIPRIEIIPSDTNWPFEFKRVQFPIQICYAMTINKSQGQSLDTVGLYLPKAAFSHEHIYVAISRVTRPEGLHILIDSCDSINTDITNNVVFEEVFYNLPSVDN
ncbi:uncharacterized protein LOC141660598 [Apium graveolens]|uniref:uncharacterized protein LOC141660598 n=1 Tax=Apium graveolens TaxID=4045 RepID=UPI003D791EFC